MRDSTRMRILMVNYEYPPLGGGGGVVTRDAAESLADRVDVTVLTSGRKGLAAEETVNGVRIVRVPVLMRRSNSVASHLSMLTFYPASLRVGSRLLAAERFDLVHTFFAVPSGPSGLRLAKRFGLPHVVSLMGGDVYDPTKRLSPHRTPLLRGTVRRVMQKSDYVTGVSNDIASRAREYFGVEGIEVIHNAWNPFPFRPVPRAELGIDLTDDDFVMVTVGRIISRKGIDRTLEVLERLDHPRPRLVVVGEGPLRPALEEQARRAGIADKVRFTGFVEEEKKWQILAASDVYVSTAAHEGFGIVFMEGMATGLPVVAYDCGGQTDFLTEDVGFAVPLGDQDAFLARLQTLAADPALRERMGAAAKETAQDFTAAKLGEKYLALYERCLAREKVAS